MYNLHNTISIRAGICSVEVDTKSSGHPESKIGIRMDPPRMHSCVGASASIFSCPPERTSLWLCLHDWPFHHNIQGAITESTLGAGYEQWLICSMNNWCRIQPLPLHVSAVFRESPAGAWPGGQLSERHTQVLIPRYYSGVSTTPPAE